MCLVFQGVIAGIVVLPILVGCAYVRVMMGGWFVGVQSLDFNGIVYLQNTDIVLESTDIISGLITASVFGFIISMMGCYHGFFSEGGAHGVGRSTMNAVVSSSILILGSNYIMTNLLFAS